MTGPALAIYAAYYIESRLLPVLGQLEGIAVWQLAVVVTRKHHNKQYGWVSASFVLLLQGEKADLLGENATLKGRVGILEQQVQAMQVSFP